MPKSKLTKAERARRLTLIQSSGLLDPKRFVKILGCDPASQASRKDRGFAEIHKFAGVAQLMQTWNTTPPSWPRFDVAVCEGQYAAKTSSRQSLISLGFGAGYCLGMANADLKLVVPVQAWKDALIPGFWNAPKQMYTNNLKQMWPQVENPHCLDAVGLGMTIARGLFSPEQLLEFVYD
jgi:hypothetical protein